MKVSEFTLITLRAYLQLDAPKFQGQTSADKAGVYYTCWLTQDNKYVKVKSNLFST